MQAGGWRLLSHVCAAYLAVDPTKTATTPTDVLLYCYYGALLEIGRQALVGCTPCMRGHAMHAGVPEQSTRLRTGLLDNFLSLCPGIFQ